MQRALASRGLSLVRLADRYEPSRTVGDRVGTVDFPPEWQATIERVRDYTLVSDERMGGLIGALEYLARAQVPGAFVETGVWRGGSSMAAAITMLRLGDLREMVLFDTYTGNPEPGELDVDFEGLDQRQVWTGKSEPGTSLRSVAAVMRSTGYDMDRVRLIAGMVEETVPREAPDAIALLRLDTDWHASIAHTLEHLWPRVVPGGVLIVDDYGHFEGARRAVDDYFADQPVLLARLDYSGRMALKR